MTGLNQVDRHIGARVRKRRDELGLTQLQLAKCLDVSFQQVQRYERGANRIAASKLFALSRVLRVPVAYFFEESSLTLQAEGPIRDPAKLLEDKDCRKLNEAFVSIASADVRRSIVGLIDTLGRRASFVVTPTTPKRQ